MSVFEIFG